MPDLREGSHSGCGANGILVWWLSRQRASGLRREHIHLRKEKKNNVTFADLQLFYEMLG